MLQNNNLESRNDRPGIRQDPQFQKTGIHLSLWHWKNPIHLPNNFSVTSYRIFISIDSLLCFRCEQEGHLAKDCPLTQNSNITDTTSPNTNTTIPTPTQSSKLPAKKIPITTKTNIDNPKQTTNKLPIEQPPILFSSERPLSQPSADDKLNYISSNDIDSMPPPIKPHKKKSQ